MNANYKSIQKIPPNIKLYIGAPIEYESERVALKKIIATLIEKNISGVIISNSNFTGSQIDFIVASEIFVWVIEIKEHRQALKGLVDGKWKLKTTGGWKPVRNFYQQTLKAKYALRDSMHSFNKKMVSHPSAALVFISKIPEESSLPINDPKVKIGGIEILDDLNIDKTKTYWDLITWNEYAIQNNLIKIENLEGAFHEHLADAQLKLQNYESKFKTNYSQAIEN